MRLADLAAPAFARGALTVALIAFLGGCAFLPRTGRARPDPALLEEARHPLESVSAGYVEYGVASWYGREFHGRLTSSGERFNMYAMTAAHRRLPFGTLVRVTCLRTGASVVVRINDRGPFVRGRSIDLSYGAAAALGIVDRGVAEVRIEVL